MIEKERWLLTAPPPLQRAFPSQWLPPPACPALPGGALSVPSEHGDCRQQRSGGLVLIFGAGGADGADAKQNWRSTWSSAPRSGRECLCAPLTMLVPPPPPHPPTLPGSIEISIEVPTSRTTGKWGGRRNGGEDRHSDTGRSSGAAGAGIGVQVGRIGPGARARPVLPTRALTRAVPWQGSSTIKESLDKAKGSAPIDRPAPPRPPPRHSENRILSIVHPLPFPLTLQT
jgi:hypothetical protein